MLKTMKKILAVTLAMVFSASAIVLSASAADVKTYNLDFAQPSWLEVPKDKEGEDGKPLGTAEYKNGVLHLKSNEAGGFPVVEKETKYGDGLLRMNIKFNRNPGFIVIMFRSQNNGAVPFWDDNSSKYGLMCLGDQMTMQIEAWKKKQGKSEAPTPLQEEINPLMDNEEHTLEILTLKDSKNRLHIKVFIDGVRITQSIDEGTTGGGPLLDAGYFGIHAYQANKTPLGVDVELSKAPAKVMAPASELTFVDESTLRYKDADGNMVYPEDEENNNTSSKPTETPNNSSKPAVNNNTSSKPTEIPGGTSSVTEEVPGTVESTAGTDSTPADESQAAADDSSTANADNEKEKSSSPWPIIIVIIVIVVLAGGGAAGFFIWKKKKGQGADAE